MKKLSLVLLALSSVASGCVGISPVESQARRSEELRQSNPSLYETERTQEKRDRELGGWPYSRENYNNR